jgi:hypothetical protein
VAIPDTVDVFLPGKVSCSSTSSPFLQFVVQAAWDAVKNKFIEEKLEKLGVEKGSGGHSTIPHIHAPHARAASVGRILCPVAVCLIFSADIFTRRSCSAVFQAQQTPTGSKFSLSFCFRLTAAISAVFEQPDISPSDVPTSTSCASKLCPSTAWT